ncbi:hypothetical protein ACO2Q2_17455 [Dyella sp. KRB-257]|uniref:hypothetical protein n=1 Tax=Dyella sp. KRB-257 TaxID=3400915 RepID=UPI003C0B5322
MNRAQWHAARRERKELADWLVTHRAPSTTGCDCNAASYDLWRQKHGRWWQLQCLIESAGTRDPNGWRILRENQARRRAHVRARITQRKRDEMVRRPGEPLLDFIDRKCGFARDAA